MPLSHFAGSNVFKSDIKGSNISLILIHSDPLLVQLMHTQIQVLSAFMCWAIHFPICCIGCSQ